MVIYRRDENEDKEEVERELEEPLLLLTDVIKALMTLQRFEMSRDDCNMGLAYVSRVSLKPGGPSRKQSSTR